MPTLPYLRTVSGAALFAVALAAVLAGAAPGAGTALAQSDVAAQKPTRHFRVEQPAGLSGADALTIYNRILDDMVAGYRLSNLPDVDEYRNWRRFNTVPYRSAQHGERFVNNYANGIGRAYGSFEEAGDLPVGSVAAKDSFAVTAAGDVTAGPLFIMEKMPQGFNYVSGDWKYTLVRPDGTLFGETNGPGAKRVEYCITCHLARERYDHLYFLPKDYRR